MARKASRLKNTHELFPSPDAVTHRESDALILKHVHSKEGSHRAADDLPLETGGCVG